LLVRRAVDMLGIREELLRRPAAIPGARAASASRPIAPGKTQENRDDVAERSLLSLMLRLPVVLSSVAAEPEARHWFGPKWRPLVDGIIAEWQQRSNVDAAQLIHQLPPELANEIAGLVLEGEQLSDPDCVKMAADCLANLKRKHLQAQKRDKRLQIRAAEEQKDENAKRERMLEWQDLLRKERQLERRKLEPKITMR
jgi:hypothetical protein